MLIDSFGRIINYLRISVTDRCNLRCLYCVPLGGFPSADRPEILSYEEILLLVECFVELGVDKIRLTGGEPLIRKDLSILVRGLKNLHEIKDISLSTNGVHLAEQAEELFHAGLKRINVSLDTFDPDKFLRITGLKPHAKVLEGIEAAIRVGFYPIKINVVVLKGINDDEIASFVAFAMFHPVEIRFIELMPTRNCFLVGNDRFVSNDIIKDEVGQLAELIPEPILPGDVARGYRLGGGLGKIGFISSLTHSFCSECNRIRLRSDGILKLCLHGDETFDLRTPLRRGATKDELISLIQEAVMSKPKGHDFKGSDEDEPVTYMCQIGG
ncbi:MAG: GTP 3',8-cyclase MoaA [Candidatus Omnitrophica bacterium]|nr:GTP 3',8-cyclase MoaA [Candidatus Omnitrophota bacterium]